MKILLVGNPNIGKSVIFSRLTGVQVLSCNYPGSTVGYTKGYLKAGDQLHEIIDVPGIYSLEPNSEAERVATEMLSGGDLIINVVNATNRAKQSCDQLLFAHLKADKDRSAI